MWLLWSGLISRRVEGDRVDWGICLRGKALLLLLVLVYKVVLPLLTFVPSTIALVGASLWLFGERSIKTIASLSIITSLLIYYIFRDYSSSECLTNDQKNMLPVIGSNFIS